MGFFSRFEDRAEGMIEGSSGRGGIEPVKLAKRAAKEMEREKMVGVGHEYAPTLYNVLVSPAAASCSTARRSSASSWTTASNAESSISSPRA